VVKHSGLALLLGLCAGVGIGSLPPGDAVAVAQTAPKSSISEEARSAIAQMGKTLTEKNFSFQARTIREYNGDDGLPLNIEHEFKVTVRRPDRLLIDGSGDDGQRTLIYDGKTVVIARDNGKDYATLPVPDTIQRMMYVVMGRFGLDFPLADFLTDDPAKAFLKGVTSGHEINTVTIDGVPCRHLLFMQPPGIELELWVEDNDRAVPRRLIVTYNAMPTKPRFIAEMFDWNFAVQSADAEFAFKPPEGAKELDFGTAAGSLHAGAP
jgi:hypothetical protein